VWSQSLPDWIGAHVNALTFFDGAPQQIVCDNLRSGITRACFYEPLVNRTYADMARYYRTTVIPARPYKARDKAKVEVGVQVVQRWILARLRHHRFFLSPAVRTRAFLARTARTCDVIPRARTGLPAIAG
jgi:transposase